MNGVYYVAQIPIYYGVVGLADTESGAMQVAAIKAKKYLDDADAIDPINGEPWTINNIITYFEPRVTVLEMGSAQFEGEGGE
jgi:hypothetical protein